MERNYELEVGDVVLVAEGGWGLLPEDESKYVEIVDKDGVGYVAVKPYDKPLAYCPEGCSVSYESFGKSPMVLLNTKEDECVAPEPNEKLLELLKLDAPDAVHSPKHYSVFDGTEAIEIIASSLTQEEFRGYCFGNLLKYRLRCGKKDDVNQELSKADKYKELYEDYKHLCKG